MNLFESRARKPLKEVEKSWGKEVWVANNKDANYCGKLLHVNKGTGFKMHFHDIKEETFYILKGKLKVTLRDTADRTDYSGVLEEGMCLDLKRLEPHAVEALEDTIIIEASTFHRDSDSYRI
jgi:quercetin dioxygenase-like cupin family protein